VNRLAGEHSPYLLQHANNPVDWFPWGNEAFEKARTEGKPIFLSIGYSTCHWCHVMAHESFENERVASVLNGGFVSIKVDREERPDVDRVYMTFVQATTGAGGWPMSVWLTPDLKPFYGGTYFPPESRWGRPGFVDILGEIARVWSAETDKVQSSADALTAQLRGVEQNAPASDLPGAYALERTAASFRDAFDRVNGGFGTAPKFPRPCELLFLFREHARAGNDVARDIALATLGAMAAGGIRDHIGGGFHRYSVDGAWRVPHFEKMLYDQAQLALAYLEASQVTGDRYYADVAEDTLRYVLRQMTDEAGGFYSAEDADSIPPEDAGQPGAHAMEGAFYLWTASETATLFGDDAPIVRMRFGIEDGGNAPADPHGEFTGKNLLYLAHSVDDIGAALGKPADEVNAVLDRARFRMFEARVGRPHPYLDDKVLTAWNGLMIAAFARAARLAAADGREAQVYLDAARKAASFIRDRMWNAGTRTLLRRYRRGEASIEAYAEDYAYLIFGVLELFQADADPAWLTWARALEQRQDELFWDDAAGAWFSTTGRDATVLLRMKDDYDGAEPSASSVSVLNLLVLSHLIEEPRWTDRIERTFKYFATRLEQMGRGVPMMASALSSFLAGFRQVVIVGDEAAGGALGRRAGQLYLPFSIVLTLTAAQRDALGTVLPFVAAMQPVDGKPAAYVCQHFTCRAPVTSVDDLDAGLTSRS
jgi:uncharacterized protein YyaL (SSP411 family)